MSEASYSLQIAVIGSLQRPVWEVVLPKHWNLCFLALDQPVLTLERLSISKTGCF